jgi:hypothetical protein
MERFRASMWTVVYRVAKFINEDVEEQRDDECRAPCDIPYCRIWCYSVLAYCVLMRMQKLSAHSMGEVICEDWFDFYRDPRKERHEQFVQAYTSGIGQILEDTVAFICNKRFLELSLEDLERFYENMMCTGITLPPAKVVALLTQQQESNNDWLQEFFNDIMNLEVNLDIYNEILML